MPSILFICNANRFRSPLAAALFKRNLHEAGIPGSWTIGSAGMWAKPGLPALPQVAAAAQTFGLDLACHRSVRLDWGLLRQYDLLVVMQAGQKEALVSEDRTLEDRVFLLSELTERRCYDIPDALESEQEMLEVCTLLDSLLRRGQQSICVMATYWYNTRQRTMESKVS
jgi:protein-tyrosine-phosphatase